MSRRNENRPGYKRTEVGWIPQNWRCSTGADITELIGKGASPRWQGFEYTSSGMLFITSENVRDGYLNLSKPKYLPIEFHNKLRRTRIRKGDILINLVGASIGRSCSVRRELGNANVNQAVCVFRVKNDICREYISYYFQNPSTIKRILEMQVDAARPNISLGDLREFRIAIPLFSEQKKIAEILSTWDNAIEQTRKLIEAKKRRKKALMQQLLTGSFQLKGFQGQIHAASLYKFFERVTRTNEIDCENVLTISGPLGLVNQRDYFNRQVASEDLSGYFLIEKGEFAYNKSSCNGYPLGALKMLEKYDRGVVSKLYICFRIRDESKIDRNFIKYYFEGGLLNRGLYSIAHEGARCHGLLNVSPKDFFKIQPLMLSFIPNGNLSVST